MTTPHPPSPTTYRSVLTALLSLPPPLLPPAPHPHSAALRAAIASLALHPTLETALHILNADLPSAHFLVRHMQAAPAHEAMFLHGILHRVEGDYDNARAWYADVTGSAVFGAVWTGEAGGEAAAWRLIDEVERLRKGSPKDKAEVDVEELGGRSLAEIRRVMAFCEAKFGTGRVEDARGIWVGMDAKSKAQSAGMIVGGEGWREF